VAALRSHPLRTRLLLGALLLAAALLLVAAPVFVLAMAPAVALFAMVASRVMPGEDLIVRLRGTRSAPRRRRPAAQRPYGVVLVRRTGRLIAAALAMRPPPARPLVITH